MLVGDEFSSGKDVQSDEKILECVKATVETVYHPSCTCKFSWNVRVHLKS